jgi:LuxR family maltose regulon positive regulatory protein
MAEAGVPRVVAMKLAPPVVRSRAIARDRLTRLLASTQDVSLTVVCAPAGYGKTTALAMWLDEAGCSRVWLSLDAQDNDPRRLCAHLLAGLDGLWPAAMADAETALLGGSDLIETVVPAMAEALAELVEGELAIVLDDYHLIDEEECHRLLISLIDALPPGARMVVSSRTLPPLRVARRRAAGTLLEIGPQELAFQGDEPELLLNGALGLGLAPAQIAAIDKRVEGWPAGLALAASSLPAMPDRDEFLKAFARSHAAVADYLIDEVLDAVNPRVRHFLCHTSILSRLSAPLCVAVLDDPTAGELLAEVWRSNLFVTVLDEEWVRYHDLFAELLQRELRTSSPELIPELHRRASAWCADNGLPEDAIRHASAAGDGERAAMLLYEHWIALFDERRYATVRQLIAEMPPDRGSFGPVCEAIDAVRMALEGADLQLLSERLDALEAHRDAPGVAPLIDINRVSPHYGDVGRAVRDGWAAWDRYPDLPVRAHLASLFGVVLWHAGDHDAVHRVVEPYVNVIEQPRLRSWALAALALTAADEGDAELAERYAREAVEIAVANGGATALECNFAYVALGEALRLQGALEEAAEQLAIAAHLTSKLPGSLFQAFTLVFEAELALSAADRRHAQAKAAAARRIVDRYPDTGVLANRLTAIDAALERRGHATRGSPPTPAELRVLVLLAKGLTRQEIATQLYLTVPTVKSHIQRLYRRLGARDRAEALVIAAERGLLPEGAARIPTRATDG